MKGLTLTQPWASLVAIGEKRIETRSWQTSYRGPLAIHAGKGLKPVGNRAGLCNLCLTDPFFSALFEGGIEGPDDLPLGAVVATADLAACLPTEHLDELLERMPSMADFEPSPNEKAFGDYTPERFGWVLRNVKPLSTPIPCSGALSLWRLPSEVERELVGAVA